VGCEDGTCGNVLARCGQIPTGVILRMLGRCFQKVDHTVGSPASDVVVMRASLRGHVGGTEWAARNLGVDGVSTVAASRSRPEGLVCWQHAPGNPAVRWRFFSSESRVLRHQW
jgi:hypothetical protein